MSNATAIDLPGILVNGWRSRLCFRNLRRTFGVGTEFIVSVEKSHPFHSPLAASVESSTHVVGPPSIFFEDLASNWRGWFGEKCWKDLDETVQLIAKCDRGGHVCLTVILTILPEDQLRVSLMYEAGSLESMSRLVSELFNDHAT